MVKTIKMPIINVESFTLYFIREELLYVEILTYDILLTIF